jgi:putative FmdB family regulatory protein
VPTYQYTCTECGDRVEAVQKFTDDPLTVCAACGGRLRKVFFPAGIVFKGSGFYRTDSRNGSSAPSAAGSGAKDSKDSKEKQATESGSAGSSDGKSADKPAAKSESASSSSSSSSGEKAA